MSAPNDIIVFMYPFSPYARRVLWYLTLRGMRFAQCLQPPILPREDLDALGIKYRRIPLLSIGNDVLCDTRLILRQLEARFPDGALGASEPDQKAIERLMERLTVEGGVFNRATQLIPPSLPLLKDPKFLKDRTEMTGREWSADMQEKGRPEALVHIRDDFELLETTLLADGRDWILKTKEPSLGDIEAIWPFHWLATMKGALAPDVISESQFPKVFGWIKRFDAAVKAAAASAPKPVTLKGPDAVSHVVGASSRMNGHVDLHDPLGYREGDDVEVWPLDSGFNHRDRGRLLSLNAQEVALGISARNGATLHLHFPRRGFRVKRHGAREANL